MRKNRLLALVLVIVMCVFMIFFDSPAGVDDSAEAGKSTPVLYRVSNESGHVIWLFGSIHLGRDDFYPLPAYVQNAFEQADSLAVEMDIRAFENDMSLQMKALAGLVYQDGSNIQDHISQELYDASVSILKSYNYYLTALDFYKPVFWYSTIESLMWTDLGIDAKLGVDRYLIDKAYDSEKEILEIESAEYQYSLLAGLEEDIQIMLLESIVKTHEYEKLAAIGMEAMLEAWASGDEKSLVAYLRASNNTLTEEEQALYQQYEQALITDRNLAMADFAENVLRSGKEVFVCVGATHIMGEGAVADLLAQRGYLVERVVK